MTSAGDGEGHAPGALVRCDGWLALGVGLVAATFHLVVAWACLPHRASLSLFGADTARVLRHMAVRGPMLDRTQFHPLFPLLTQPPVRALQAVGLDRLVAAQVVVAVAGGVFAAAVYGTGRRCGLRPMDALAPAALAIVAGSSVFFFAIPETFGVSAAIAAVVLFVIAGWDGPPSLVQAVGVLVAGGSAVVLGALAPLVAIWSAERRWSRRVTIVAIAAATVLALLLVQAVAFGTRLRLQASGEDEFIRHDRLAGAGDSLRTLLASAWAVPKVRRPPGLGPTTVDGSPWAHDVLGVVALVLLAAFWVLLVVGVWRRRHHALVPVLLVALTVHVVGFSLYGDEGFLYSAPLIALALGLVVVAASAVEIRRPLVAICWALVPVLVVVNVNALADAGRLLGG